MSQYLALIYGNEVESEAAGQPLWDEVEAEDLDEAIAIVKDIPMPFGGVEVRPVMVFDR